MLFDIGETLITGPAGNPVDQLVEVLGLDRERYKGMVKHTLFCQTISSTEELINAFSPYVKTEDQQQRLIAKIWDNQRNLATKLPDVGLMLNRMKEDGYEIGFMSNICTPYYKRFLDLYPDEGRNGHTFLSCEMGFLKPDKRFFEAVLSRLERPAHEVVLIGDSYKNDMLPAILEGIKTHWFIRDPAKAAETLVHIAENRLPKPTVIEKSW